MAGLMSHGARSALFAPLDQTGRAEAVTRRLVDAISLGLLTEAEQLPSESELAGRFGVSTVTVREALVALRQLGLVETRRGRGGGSFVRAPRAASTAASAWTRRLRAVSLSELRDLGDHYAAVAGAAARLAAERSSAEDLARLELACRDIRGAEGPALSRAERVFHLELAAAAQSPRLTHQELALQAEQGGLLWLPLYEPRAASGPASASPSGDGGGDPREAAGPGDAHAAHRDIARAVADGDGDAARAHTEEHILAAVDRLAELHLSLLDP
ncbi:MAG TPA: GntR family transcriptional regulator [Pseudonocardia sp.]|jgi:DNA-binding FadR family transcriptional regulator